MEDKKTGGSKSSSINGDSVYFKKGVNETSATTAALLREE